MVKKMLHETKIDHSFMYPLCVRPKYKYIETIDKDVFQTNLVSLCAIRKKITSSNDSCCESLFVVPDSDMYIKFVVEIKRNA